MRHARIGVSIVIAMAATALGALAPNDGSECEPITLGSTPWTIYGKGFESPVQVYLRCDSNVSAELDIYSISANQIVLASIPVWILGCEDQSDSGCELEVRAGSCAWVIDVPQSWLFSLPAISAVSPASGSGEVLITVHGQGFIAPLTLELVEANSESPAAWPLIVKGVADREVVAVVPESTACGKMRIRACHIEYGGDCCSDLGGEYTVLPPVVTSTTPGLLPYPSGFPLELTIQGKGFSYPTEVGFAGYSLIVPASERNTSTRMSITLPAPPASALRSEACAGEPCLERYSISSLPIAITSQARSGCRVVASLDLLPDDVSCRAIAATEPRFAWWSGPAGSGEIGFRDATRFAPGAVAVARRWSFPGGDPPESIDMSPSVRFAPGTHSEVTLEIDDGCGEPKSLAKSIDVPRGGAIWARHGLIVPAAASADGIDGSHWSTDLVLSNLDDDPQDVTIYFLETAKVNVRPAPLRTLRMEPQSTLVLDDLLAAAPSTRIRVGALALAFDRPTIRVTSRTRRLGADGCATGGQALAIAAIDLSDLATSVDSLELLPVAGRARVRTNLGLVNAASVAARFRVRLRANDGIEVMSRTIDVPQWGHVQVTDVLATWGVGLPNGDGRLTIESETEGVLFAAYLSALDERTGEAIYWAGTRAPLP